MKLSVVIPVYNEKNTIEEIVKKVREVPNISKEIIIVDDASTDGTRDILKKMEQDQPDLKIIYKSENKGKGDTLALGFKSTTGDYVIVQDADLEYDPMDYEKLLRVLGDGNVDVVYGSRFSGNYEEMSSLHYVGNKFLTMFTNIFFGVLLTDMETCYKLMPGNFVRSLSIKSLRFDFEPEITAKILKAHLRIREVPIAYKGRSHAQGKKITWRDGFSALATLVKFRFFD